MINYFENIMNYSLGCIICHISNRVRQGDQKNQIKTKLKTTIGSFYYTITFFFLKFVNLIYYFKNKNYIRIVYQCFPIKNQVCSYHYREN